MSRHNVYYFPSPKICREQRHEALKATIFPMVADVFFIAAFFSFYSSFMPTKDGITAENPIWKFHLVLGISIGARILALWSVYRIRQLVKLGTRDTVARAYTISIANLPVRLFFGLMDYYLLTWISFPYHKTECEFNIKYGILVIGFQQLYGFASIYFFMLLEEILREFKTDGDRKRCEDTSESEA